MNTFLSALKARRTCYRIGSGSPIDDSQISGLVKEAVSVTPSAFNTTREIDQTIRILRKILTTKGSL